MHVCCILHTHQHLLDSPYALDGQVTLACEQCLTNGIISVCEWIIHDTTDNYEDTYWRINSTTKQKADQGQTLVLGHSTETSMRTVFTLMCKFAVLAEGHDVHTKDFWCQWHYVLVGG
jgi:hypothetical protein